MSRERAMELWSRLSAGESLSAAESRELLEILKADAELRERLMRNDEVDGLLRALHWTDTDAALFEESFEERVGAERDGARFIRSMESRLAATRRFKAAPSSGNPWAWGLAAAALLFGLVYLVSAPSPRVPDRAVRREPAVARPVENRERLELEKKLAEAEAARKRATEEKKRAENESKAAELREREAELERTVAEFKARLAKAPAPEPQPPAPQPEPPAPSKPAPQTEARVVVAKIISPEGETFLYAGQGLDAAGTTTLEFTDKTRIELGSGTLIKEVRIDPKRIVLDKGTLRAEVEKQPQGKPMVFATPFGDATVLGTTLKIVVDPVKGTRLDVEEGRVQLRNLSGKSVDVLAGHYAVAAAGAELVSMALPIEDIVIYGSKGRAVGGEWRFIKDDQSLSGTVVEAYYSLPSFDGSDAMLKKRLASGSYAEFTFAATANLEYSLWIRGRTTGTPPEHHDALSLEFVGGQFNVPARTPGHVFMNGWGNRGADMSYWWVGAEADQPDNTAFLTVKFPKSGRQVLRIYGVETPMRIDSIWLSTNQKSRPADTQRGPK